jgi:spermidine synthase
VPFIFRKINGPTQLVFSVGLFSAAVQTVYFREYLSVVSGNELSLGMIFAVWLVCTGLGASLASGVSVGLAQRAQREDRRNGSTAALLLVTAAIAGIFCIRAGRLLFAHGQAFSPLAILGLLAVSEAPFAFVNGYSLGSIFSSAKDARKLYQWENTGSVAGALCVYACIFLFVRNSGIIAVSALPLVLLCRQNAGKMVFAVAAGAALFVFDTAAIQWKYGVPIRGTLYGHEGELATVVAGKDTTILQNGVVYKSTLEKPVIEQAVHIPMGERPTAHRALVVFDRGHTAELAKYAAVSVDRIETEPVLASPTSIVCPPEAYRSAQRYDCIFLGTGMPKSASTGRFYTRSFFLRMKSLMADSGILTFTLPFSENYLSPPEQTLYNALYSTLASVFGAVLVFPGEGYTFMGSNGSLSRSWNVRVSTDYLSSSIVPGVSHTRLERANKLPAVRIINSSARPIAMLLGLASWLENYRSSAVACGGILALLFAMAFFWMPKTRSVLSMATSGFTIGVYSICLLLLYQATYGALYSRVALLFVALTAGFGIGAMIKRFPFSDGAIGLYAVGSLSLLSIVSFPPAVLFYCFHAGIGVLGGAQMVSRQESGAGLGPLYAADSIGGALGMAICSTLLIPLFGILPVAIGVGGIKIVVEIVNLPGRFSPVSQAVRNRP